MDNSNSPNKIRVSNLVFEERPHGVHLTVDKQLSQRVNLENLETLFHQSNIMNADVERIRKIIKRAKNIPEFAGAPFSYFKSEKENFISIEIKPLEAIIIVSPTPDGLAITYEDLYYTLLKNNISYGLNKEKIHEIIEKELFNVPIKVASGKEPVDGLDAKVEYKIDINISSAPLVLSSGKVDFHKLDLIKTVDADKLIAIKHPPTLGTDGISVTSSRIPAIPGKDERLPSGKNTYSSEDNLKLFASCKGYMYMSELGVNIGELYIVNNHVDFSTGDLDYTGDIIIRKNILGGFKVEAMGDILVQGLVEDSAVVSKGGSITVMGGLLGKKTGTLTANQNISINRVQEGILSCGGKISVKKNLLHSNVTADGDIEILNDDGYIIGGRTSSYTTITTPTIGNEQGTKTIISLLSKSKEILTEKIRLMVERYKEIDKKIEKMAPRLKLIEKMTSEVKHLSAQGRAQIKKTHEEHKTLLQFKGRLGKKLIKLKEEFKAPSKNEGYILVKKDIYPNTVFDLYGTTLEVLDKRSGGKIHLKENVVKIDSQY